MPRSKYKQTYFMSGKDGPAPHPAREREVNRGEMCTKRGRKSVRRRAE